MSTKNFVSYGDAETLMSGIKDAIDNAGGGGGSGDMQTSVYDPQGTVATAGGIVAYIDDVITDALTASY